MAPPAEINQNLPDTLPADFGDWDSEESQAPGAVESPKAEPPKSDPAKLDAVDQGPRRSAARDAVARQSTPNEAAPKPTPTRESTARELAPRSVDSERTAPIPRSPMGPPPANPRAYATPSSKGPRAVPASGSFPEDEVLFRRVRSLNTVVDTLPAAPQAPQPRETPQPWEPPLPKEEMAAVVTLPAPVVEQAPAKKAEVEEEHPLSFRTDLSQSENEEERRARRKWIAIISVAVGVAVLVVFQLLHYGTLSQVRHMVAAPSTTTINNDGVPDAALAAENAPAGRPLTAKPSPSTLTEQTTEAPQETDAASSEPAPVQSRMMHDQLLAPSRIPKAARAGNDAPPAEGFAAPNMAALGGNSANNAVFNGSAHSKMPTVELRSPTVSAGVATGMLIHRTQPIYPTIAKSARVTGTVVIQATISRTGTVLNPQVLSGPQMLRQAALDAVKTWRYRPYKLNNEPTEVDTTVNIVFALN